MAIRAAVLARGRMGVDGDPDAKVGDDQEGFFEFDEREILPHLG